MLGIKTDNTPIQGKQADKLLRDMKRWSQGNFNAEELRRINQEAKILKRFNVEWKN